MRDGGCQIANARSLLRLATGNSRPQYNQGSLKGDTATETERSVEHAVPEGGQIPEKDQEAITSIILQEVELE